MDLASWDRDSYRGETREQLLEATRQALCNHGFADLTMQAIADESDKSKAALHYHFDTKEQLLAATLEYLLEEFLEEVDVGENDDPETQLRGLIEAMLFGPNGREGDSSEHWEFHTALLEVQSHAPHDETYRAQFTDNFDSVRKVYAEIIRDGIKQGLFRDVDPEAVATHIMTSIKGARVHQVATEHDDVAASVHDTLRKYVVDPMVLKGH